ncbi:hypothetical protein [Planobispora rosea]|uniref:hypothetical protein n=1 Tax=Planobispora rosea TaxID=35762 RepID=UPI00083A2B32|nr:hypothetical protein [Planobispora rosea]
MIHRLLTAIREHATDRRLTAERARITALEQQVHLLRAEVEMWCSTDTGPIPSLLGHEACAVCRDCVGCGATRGCPFWCAAESRS